MVSIEGFFNNGKNILGVDRNIAFFEYCHNGSNSKITFLLEGTVVYSYCPLLWAIAVPKRFEIFPTTGIRFSTLAQKKAWIENAITE